MPYQITVINMIEIQMLRIMKINICSLTNPSFGLSSKINNEHYLREEKSG